MLNRKFKIVVLLIAVTQSLSKTLIFEAVVGKSKDISTVNSSNTNVSAKDYLIFQHLPSKYIVKQPKYNIGIRMKC